MSSSYTNEVLEQDAREQAQKRDQQNRAAWNEICDSCDVSEGEAFYQQVLKFCEGEITPDKFAMMQATCPDGYDLTNRQWWTGTKERLIAQLLQRKRAQLAPSGVLDPRDAVELRNFEVNLHNLSKKELRAKRREFKFRDEIKTASDAKTYLARHRLLESQQKFYFTKDGTRYERLPSLVVPQGFVQAIPLDAKFLIKILDSDGLRKYVARYGPQINERIADTRDSLRGE